MNIDWTEISCKGDISLDALERTVNRHGSLQRAGIPSLHRMPNDRLSLFLTCPIVDVVAVVFLSYLLR
jgi:hypothetical protein